jgi:AraC-like DNA-binding protein
MESLPDPADRKAAVARLAQRITQLAPEGVMTESGAPGLLLYASRAPAHRLHLVYQPSLCVVAQGQKAARVAGRAYAYDPTRFFFSAVPLPAALDVSASVDTVLVGLVLHLDLELVARVALEIDDVASSRQRGAQHPELAFTGAMTAPLAGALERLVASATDDVRRQVLYPGVLREVCFELLSGREGGVLRRELRQHRSLRAVIESARYIDTHFTEELSVPMLAQRAGMSESAYFARFREATCMSPLQYLKRIRLVRARALIAAGQSVTEAAFAVGYASVSQFSREYRRAFGCPPRGSMQSRAD